MKQRLQKILARAGYGSRRSCEKLITEGRVCVNGVTVTELGSRADSGKDIVTVDGERVKPERNVYILLNKPRGYLCTNADPWGRRIVRSLLTDVHQRLYTVGRLDRDAEGLLLLTNDGQFAHRVAHPRNKVPKTYEVQIRGELSPKDKKRLERGIWLNGRKTAPAKIRPGRAVRGGQGVTVTIFEGRKRQVKRMFRAVGCTVTRLKRVAIGELRLGRLPAGNYRFLKREELDKIFAGRKGR